MNDPEARFIDAMVAEGLPAPPHIMRDGRIHRFSTNGRKADKAGWYIAHPNEPPMIIFGDWRTGLRKTWCARSIASMSSAERRAHKDRLKELQRQREEDQVSRFAEVAREATRIWQEAPPAPPDHPYLRAKHIPPTGAKLYQGDLSIIGGNMDGALVVPLQDEAKTLWSLEFITHDGKKFFLPGGRKRGCFCLLGESTETICITEGYATGVSVHEATGKSVAIAFDAGNLEPVAQALRAKYSQTRIILCGDNDASGTGQTMANAAAEAIGGIVALPMTQGDDWNDVHRRDGLDAVRDLILKALNTTELSSSSADIGLVKELADAILTTNHFAKDSGGALYIYRGGAYRLHGEETVAQAVKRLLEQNGDTKHWSSYRAREVMEFIRVDAPRLWERPPVDTLNLANGLFDIESGMLRKHSPEHLTSIQLPVAYDPVATCPIWESFIARVLPDDCRTLAYELVASAMRGDIADQKAILLVGSGGNGKSTLLNAVVSFLGKENVSALTLHRLETDRFASVRLYGKLANVCADLPSDHLSSTSTFKALTGGDVLTAERKFQQSFEYTPFARLIFSANHYPRSKDSSQAVFRRLHVIPCDAVIAPHERDPYLIQKLTMPSELSGILNLALAALPGLRQRGGFTDSESTQAAMMEFREMTDPLAVWLDCATVLRSGECVSRKDLLIAYNAHAVSAGRPLMSQKAFCEAVRRLRPMVKDAQRTVRGTMQRVFLGLAIANLAGRESHESHHSSQISLGEQETQERTARREGNNLNTGHSVNGVSAVITVNQNAPGTQAKGSCFSCRGSRFWISLEGGRICAQCHPPISEKIVQGWEE